LVIPVDEFKKEGLLRLSNQFLHRYEKLKLLNVGIYTDDTTASDSAGKGKFDFTYGVWKSEFEARRQKNSLRAAELLKYGDSASLRIRYSDGRIEEIEIVGRNVFRPVINGVALHLLHVSFPRQGFGNAKQVVPHFYFSISETPTSQDAAIIATSIFRASDAKKMKLHLRQDEWFIFDAYYPWMNPFTEPGFPPTQAEAARSAEFLCNPAEEQACYQSSLGVSP
jgi:hypothetical protein